MKTIIAFCLCFLLISNDLKSQNENSNMNLTAGMTLQKTMHKGEKHEYIIQLNKDENLEMTILQKGVDLIIDAYDPGNKLIKNFDTPNGQFGPEVVNIVSETAGIYKISIYPLIDDPTLSDSLKEIYADMNQGDYEITSVEILSGSEYQKKLEAIKVKQSGVIASLKEFAHPIKSVLPGNGFEDLEFLKPVLKEVK